MNFDEIIDRRGTGSLKWDDPRNEAGKEDILPFWVADMDFAAPPAVLEAVRERAAHPVFGYTNPPEDYFRILADWYRRRYRVDPGQENFLLGPGAVPSLGIALRSMTTEGAGVLALSPVYSPFYDIVRDNGRELVSVSLAKDAAGRYRIDFRAIEEASRGAESCGTKVEALLFCSPHNPGGRIWSPEELGDLLDFCRARGIVVVSDEIHADIVVGDAAFTSLAGDRSASGPSVVVIGAPNKTFNLAGLHLSHFVAGGGAVRERLRKGIAAAGYSQPDAFSIVAARAAYLSGEPWLEALNAYLRSNIDFAEAFIRERIPGISFVRPEGGYLAWLDATEAIRMKGLSGDEEYASRLAREGRVRLSYGRSFGIEGLNHLRLNLACPRSQLSEGLERWARWATA